MKIDYQLLNDIANNEGPSFYIVDTEKFKKNYRSLLNAFQKYYKNTKIAYSYKTNYIPRFCKIINELGGFAEVVSGMEMELAITIGVNVKNIYYNGPYKEIDYIKKLIIEDGNVNVDSLDELYCIINLVKEYPKKKFKIGLRCNFDINDNTVSRFGIDVYGEDFKNALDEIKKYNNLKIAGLHCHYPSRSIASWQNRTNGMIDIIEKYFKYNINDIEYISLGGGLYGEMNHEMKKQFEIEIPTFDEYASVSAKKINEYFNNINIFPLMIIEPGTALVSDCVKYVTRVISIKNIRQNTIVNLTGSIYNINPVAKRKNVPIEIYSKNKESQKVLKNAKFAGYTCVENDYLYSNYNGQLGIGDFIIFDYAGSYSIVMKPPFIMPNVAIIELNNKMGEKYSIIKNRETFQDVFKTYNI
jgi:diaminopimelate decarboxylase